MKLTVIFAALAGLAVTGAAHASTAQSVADQCIFETRSGGAFSLSTSGSVPQVSAGAGATASAAHNVNDCIKDKYAVQYGSGTGITAREDDGTNWYNAVHVGGCEGGPMWGGNGYCFRK